jgi:serine/threonine-protein kinase
LNHPNIATIYGFETAHSGAGTGSDSITFLVMELLEGESLRQVIGGGGLTTGKVPEYGMAIADGLAAAHDKKIIHRDLKPENVFLTKDGRIKILDFGLAKSVPADTTDGLHSEMQTETMATAAGIVVGTAGYMSPEQLRGERVDHRTDIFALGCVVFEMLAGRRAFTGKTEADVVSAILTHVPPALAESVSGVPPELSAIVARCLEKRPEQRFQSARDLGFALGSVTPGPSSSREEPGPTADDRSSVAVLPFANLSADPEQEYFCDGMAEEIINALAQVRGLRVIARTSAFAFKGKNEDIREIGSALDVATIVEGSVRKAGERLRITAQLIDVRDGSHLWSERFDRRMEDVFEIQDEIALAVVENLEVTLLGRERAAVVRRPTDNLEAYEAYLKGWYQWYLLTQESYLKSRECFEEAIRIDPNFAAAYVGMAVTYLSQSYWAELSPKQSIAVALPLAMRALELDDSLPEVHLFFANIRSFERKWQSAEESHQRARELGPNIAEVHGQHAALLLVLRQFDRAIEEIRLAQRLDPLSPTWNAWTYSWLAMAGLHDEGLAGLEGVAAAHPSHWMPRHFLSVQYGLDGRFDEARAQAEKAVELSGGISNALTQLACTCYVQGDTDRGDELFEKLRLRAEATYVPPTFIAWIHLTRGEVDQALRQLETAVGGLDPWLSFHRVMRPPSAPDDPRIEALLEEVGL